jgi:death-on-curing protein
MAVEPRWLSRATVDRLQERLRQQHGGNPGVLSDHLIESALARPRHQFAYAGADLVQCAAAYLYGLAKNHGYADANKRVAYLAAVTFLRLNGVRIVADATEILTLMVDVATGRVHEEHVALWLRAHQDPTFHP